MAAAPPAPQLQRRRVEDATPARLKVGDRYFVVSQKWWAAWKEHVNFDAGAGIDGLRLNDAPAPGPIANEPLGVDDGGERILRENLVEHDDYALVCAEVWAQLREWHGGGPEFPCRVVQGASSADLSVEIYPLRFDARAVERDGRAAPRDAGAPALRASRCSQFGHARAFLERAVRGGPPVEERRIWVRAAAEEDYVGESRNGEPRELSEKFWGRDCDSDDDGEGEWKLLEGDEAAMLGGVEAIHACREAPRWGALVEVRARRTPGGNVDWPRDLLRERWRAKLAPGTVVDARDSEGRWFDSVVVEVEATKVKIHFRGWSSRWDTWIDRDDASSLQPLFARTEDWRRLRVDDPVEIRSADGVKALWYEARVVDVAGDRVEVQTVAPGAGAPPRWLETSSELLCRMGTHIKKSRSRDLATRSREHDLAERHRADPYGLRGDAASARHSSARDARPGRSHVRGAPPSRGAVGLSNLGNTCFMNSMLQCLSHTRPLTEYFLADDARDGRPKFLDEVNADNPLGAGGQLARAYADFVRDVWSGKFSVVVPTALKRTIGTHAPQFSGYQQHDSQELMTFVLDGLHEDLNRVRKKPYVEDVEGERKPDAEAAREGWQRCKLRNDSVVVDHAYGMWKSHITCPNCDHQSITFDPFLSVTLPLPTKPSRKVSVTLVRRSPAAARPERFVVAVEKRDTVEALKAALCRLAFPDGSVRGDDLDLCDVWGHRFYRTLGRDFVVEHIKPNDEVVAYELGPRGPSTRTVDVLLGTCHTRLGGAPASPYDLFGLPLRLRVDARATVGDVRADVAARVGRYAGAAEDGGPSYRLRISSASGTRYEGDPPADEEVLPADVETLTLEWTLDEVRAAVDGDEVDARDEHASARAAADRDAGKGGIHLTDCLRKLAEREELGETDQWYCSKCKQHCRAFKKLDLWSTPEVLVLHLKRFQYAQNTYFVHRQKIDDLVRFPLHDLDLSPYVLDPASAKKAHYDLYAVSEHSGGLGGGHYTATALDDATGVWYHYNDSVVTRADPANIVTPQAYVLFYKRKP